MAKIILKGVTFSTAPTSAQTATVKYKATADPDSSYVTVSSSVNIQVSGEINPDIEIDGLVTGTAYTVAVILHCNNQTFYHNTSIDDPITYVWVEATYACEKDDVLTEVATFTGFSSPAKLCYHPSKGRMYVIDCDNVAGNVYWFNPTTITGVADITVMPGVQKTIYDTSIFVDTARSRAYMAGENSDGLIVFDMETDSVAAIIPYGVNVAYGRLLVTMQNDWIYCSYRNGATNMLYIINPNTLTLASTLTVGDPGFPSSSLYFTDGYSITAVGSELWVAPAAGRPAQPIAVYNQSLTTLITTITPPSLVYVDGGSKYWGTCFYDSAKDKYYYQDVASNTIAVYTGATKVLEKTFTLNNREGKAYTTCTFKIDPNTQKLLINYNAFDTLSEAAGTRKNRTYIVNRDTLEIEHMLPDVYIGDYTNETGTSFVWGTATGLASWMGSPGWGTDGKIVKLTY